MDCTGCFEGAYSTCGACERPGWDRLTWGAFPIFYRFYEREALSVWACLRFMILGPGFYYLPK